MVAKTRTTRTATTNRAPERKKRIPVSGEGRNIMVLEDQDPAYVYRWVNDKDGRIERFKLGGYELVRNTTSGDRSASDADDVDSMVTKKVGNNITAYAMRIKREWWEEDQASKHKRVDESEASLFRTLEQEEKGSNYGKVVFERK